jgi:hypothetical protein
MTASRPISIDGRLVAAAVANERHWSIVALDGRVEDLHGARFPSPDAAERAVLALFRGPLASLPAATARAGVRHV